MTTESTPSATRRGDSKKTRWTGRIAWGGVLVLGAASAMVLALSPNIDDLMAVRHELPTPQLRTPDRDASAMPADAAGIRVQPASLGSAPPRLLDLRLVATVTDPDDTRAAVADDEGLWIATGGGLLRMRFDAPDEARWWTTADGLPDHRLTAIETIPGGLALGTEGGGVLMVSVADGAPVVIEAATVSDSRVSDLLFADEALYVATWGSGVFLSDGTDEALAFRSVGPKTGMRSRQITSIAHLDGELLAGTAGAGLWVRGTDGRPRRYVARGGLAGDFVLDLVIRDDAVWAATPTGVSRYQRGALQTWTGGERLPVGMPRALGADGSVAMGGGRVARFGHLDSVELPRNPDGLGPWNGVPIPEVRWLIDAGEHRWAGTDRGVVVEDGTQWRWVVHPGSGSNDVTTVSAQGDSLLVGTFDRGAWRDGVALPLGNAEVNDALIDGEGIAWVATSGGLARVDAAGEVRTFGSLHGLDSAHVTSIAADDGSLWIGTSAGVQRFDGGSFESALGGGEAERVSHVYTVVASDGVVLGGTLNGLWNLRRSGGTLFRYESGELPDNWVNGLAIGSAGRLWVGTYDHGLAVRELDGRWHWLTEASGLSCGWVNPDAMASLPDGTVLAGTMGGGLLRVAPNGEVDRWTMADGLAGDDVTSVSVDGDSVWIGTRSGLSHLEIDDGHAS